MAFKEAVPWGVGTSPGTAAVNGNGVAYWKVVGTLGDGAPKDSIKAMWLPRTSEHDNCTWEVGTLTGWVQPNGNLIPCRAETATPQDVDTVPWR